MVAVLTLVETGSSPLTRGKQVLRGAVGVDRGLIPAHAGKTVAKPVAAGAIRAHPRSRGENINAGSYLQTIEGSSPLTRGKRYRHFRGRFPGRLIPAHAGKTGLPGSRARSCRAHPRSRGENSPLHLTPSEIQGSSPLTRGKLQVGGERVLGGGLIPAHAGKT